MTRIDDAIFDEARLAETVEAFGEPRIAPILNALVRSATEDTAKIMAMIAAGDFTQARAIAHSMKGGAASLSAQRLADAAHAIEHAPHQPTRADAEHLQQCVTETADWVANRYAI